MWQHKNNFTVAFMYLWKAKQDALCDMLGEFTLLVNLTAKCQGQKGWTLCMTEIQSES